MFSHIACLGQALHSFSNQRILTFVEISLELGKNEI